MTLKRAMMPQTGSWHCFPFLFLLFTLHLNPILAYFLKDCTILYSDNVTAGVSVDCGGCGLVSIPDDIPIDVMLLKLESNGIQKINGTDFYNLTNLRLLDLGFNSITHVDDGAFLRSVELKWLDMISNGLTTLTENMFQGLLHLTHLNVSQNCISHVDDGAFVHLMELKVLNMQNNELTTLTDNMFQGLSNLLQLDLSGNDIQFIHPAALQSLHSLQTINLKSNQILPILQLPRLQVLSISIDELVSFQSKDLPLNRSSELRELSVYSRSIKTFSITTAVFPHLETIDLSGCCNASGWEWDIPDKSFLRNITTVYFDNTTLSFNNIRKCLQSLDSLEILKMHRMEKWINRGLLIIVCKIPTLKTLDLMYNTIDSEKLSSCTQLTSLSLLFCGLTEVPKDSIKQMKQLRRLDLQVNSLSKVPDDVKHLSMLQKLYLCSNQIYDLSCSDFSNLTRLTHLHLNGNYISELKGCFFQHLNELIFLDIGGNPISTFFDMFKIGLQKLETLELEYSTITLIRNGDLKSLKLLKHLKMLSEKSVEMDSTAFEGLDKLETLSLQCYGIDIKNTSTHEFTLLKSLKELTIQSDVTPSYITCINTPKLEILDLSYSELKSLDFLAQANLTRVSQLDLRQNELTVINVSVFRFLPALRYIEMGGNPFACDCSNYDFQKWMLNNNQTQVVGAPSYTCGYPLAKKGTRFLDFDYHSCEQMDARFICYISSTCVIVLTLITSFTYHFLRLHLLYAYYLFLAFLYDAKKRKRGSPQHYDAFISYNVHDELWVYREMLPVLEGEQGWRLCLHHRDFQPGKPIVENIAEAIYGSRKTICVISHRYLKSEWCSREIHMASYRLFDEKKDVLILVFLEDIPAQRLSPYYHMRRLVKRQTYLSWSQAGRNPGLFWQNLHRALETGDTNLSI